MTYTCKNSKQTAKKSCFEKIHIFQSWKYKLKYGFYNFYKIINYWDWWCNCNSKKLPLWQTRACKWNIFTRPSTFASTKRGYFHWDVESIEFLVKKVCNGGVACSLLKLGNLKKTVIASLIFWSFATFLF